MLSQFYPSKLYIDVQMPYLWSRICQSAAPHIRQGNSLYARQSMLLGYCLRHLQVRAFILNGRLLLIVSIDIVIRPVFNVRKTL